MEAKKLIIGIFVCLYSRHVKATERTLIEFSLPGKENRIRLILIHFLEAEK